MSNTYKTVIPPVLPKRYTDQDESPVTGGVTVVMTAEQHTHWCAWRSQAPTMWTATPATHPVRFAGQDSNGTPWGVERGVSGGGVEVVMLRDDFHAFEEWLLRERDPSL